jgi:hypothetical protein
MIINLIVAALIAYHALQVGRVNYWVIAIYVLFLLFLMNRARRLKSRVAEIVDLAAHRAGLTRIGRAKIRDKKEPGPEVETAAPSG